MNKRNKAEYDRKRRLEKSDFLKNQKDDYCKNNREILRQRSKQFYIDNKKKILDRSSIYRERKKELLESDPEYARNHLVPKRLLQSARHRSRKFGLPFDLSVEDIIVPLQCPVLGINLSFNNSKMEGNSPSLDRLVPSMGYVKNNICVISARANRIKTDANIIEIEKILSYMKEYSIES